MLNLRQLLSGRRVISISLSINILVARLFILHTLLLCLPLLLVLVLTNKLSQNTDVVTLVPQKVKSVHAAKPQL